jgi:hypothetical protein
MADHPQDWSDWSVKTHPSHNDTLKYLNLNNNTDLCTSLKLPIQEQTIDVFNTNPSSDTQQQSISVNHFPEQRRVILNVKECWTNEPYNIHHQHINNSHSNPINNHFTPKRKQSAIAGARLFTARAIKRTINHLQSKPKTTNLPEKDHSQISTNLRTDQPIIIQPPQKTEFDKKKKEFDAESVSLSSENDTNKLIQIKPKKNTIIKIKSNRGVSICSTHGCLIFIAGFFIGILTMIIFSIGLVSVTDSLLEDGNGNIELLNRTKLPKSHQNFTNFTEKPTNTNKVPFCFYKISKIPCKNLTTQ